MRALNCGINGWCLNPVEAPAVVEIAEAAERGDPILVGDVNGETISCWAEPIVCSSLDRIGGRLDVATRADPSEACDAKRAACRS